ncbi:hypothetical protein MasN3_26300 [Massilia varians]|uniref:Uncharacterized protein n=1 Tax=Massilia varians TaxID=457921 RepID=A0ABM8C7B3_9BURK|nr:hypothetical protein MasN3_26300 [Massilia varians]
MAMPGTPCLHSQRHRTHRRYPGRRTPGIMLRWDTAVLFPHRARPYKVLPHTIILPRRRRSNPGKTASTRDMALRQGIPCLFSHNLPARDRPERYRRPPWIMRRWATRPQMQRRPRPPAREWRKRASPAEDMACRWAGCRVAPRRLMRATPAPITKAHSLRTLATTR